MEIIEKSLNLLRKYPLCDNCLGRCFALLGEGLPNDQRGKTIKTLIFLSLYHSAIKLGLTEDLKRDFIALAQSNYPQALSYLKKNGINVERKTCYICSNIFNKISYLLEFALRKIVEYEFDTFLVGSSIPKEYLAREDQLKNEFKLEYSESLKRELNRVIGKKLQRLVGRCVSFNNPDIIILFNFKEASVEIQSSSVFIYGKYRKLVRGIPQSKWGRRKLRKDKSYVPKYNISVEELIASPILNFFQAKEAILHAAGREDIDALMLGHGRPFVIEIKNPKKRNVQLEMLNEAINNFAKGYIEVNLISYTNKDKVREIKMIGQKTRKIYRALVEVDRKVTQNDLEKIEKSLSGATIFQRTPTRVLHRRSDKLRHKKVYKVDLKLINENTFEMKIDAQGGLYIKELIDGDHGRTTPSVSEILNASARCIELDVLDIILEGE
ncbi:MAG: tRNA pseudouridine(54/55) synthase Pus10 [Candidatus Odinarchaeota archaeon]|nr:tRNA pseudouridine(54/55) synthase Pus10 [Candidatus Odinarchaeota archaeon]